MWSLIYFNSLLTVNCVKEFMRVINNINIHIELSIDPVDCVFSKPSAKCFRCYLMDRSLQLSIIFSVVFIMMTVWTHKRWIFLLKIYCQTQRIKKKFENNKENMTEQWTWYGPMQDTYILSASVTRRPNASFYVHTCWIVATIFESF